ncbi:MAG: hypothetical protein ACYTG0_15360 [Planctomycetota bacterium]|jgi:hypothetical protein
MAKIEIFDLIKLEVSLDEVLRASRQILKNTKNRQVRDALKTMFREVKKADKTLVKKVLVPLFAIQTQNDFDKDFQRIRKRFKAIRLASKGLLIQINCGLVTNKLEALQKSQAWKKRLPLVNRSFARLEVAAQGWVFCDWILARADQNMMAEINDFMDAISKQKSAQPNRAFAEFQAGLKGIEKTFMRIKKHLAELEVLSDKL